MNEVELKFLDIDVNEIKSKLEKLGAVLIYDTYIESYSFYSNDFHGSDSSKKYLRVRKIDNEIIVTYKDPAKDSDMTLRQEVEISVNDYENTLLLFEKLGFKKGGVFRKHRVHYEFNNIHFELDTLENIPTYLEIETTSEDDMRFMCVKLDLDITKGRKGTIIEIFPNKFN